jgi:hypothetical protein
MKDGPSPHGSSTGTPVGAPISFPASGSKEYSKKELIALLGIPEHLTTEPKNLGLRNYYHRYKACLEAIDLVQRKAQQGTWPGVKPSNTQIIQIFASKSMWHTYMVPAFESINNLPDVKDWLEDKEGVMDVDVWGKMKGNYTFTDLKELRERVAQRMGAQDKGKKNQNDEIEVGQKKAGKKQAKKGKNLAK